MNQQKIFKVGDDYTERHKQIAADNTYGKGIRPESVDAMQTILGKLIEQVDNGIATPTQVLADAKNIYYNSFLDNN